MKLPRRILLVRLSHLGDVVHALPVFHALRAGYPEAELAWVVQTEFAELVLGLPGLDRTICFERRGGARAWSALHAQLAHFGADWAIDAQGNTKSALVALASGAARRSGYHPAQWTERFGAHGLTDAAPRAGSAHGPTHAPIHALDRSLALARHVAPHVDLGTPRTDPGLSATERAAGHAALDAWVGPGAADGVIVHLAAPGDVRSWPARDAAELARALGSDGTPTLVLSGPGEADAGRAVEGALEGMPAVRHKIGQRGLRELAGVFAAAAERGFRLVACDSGPLHLAAASGLPVVGLAGPQDPRRTGPWPVPATSGSPHRSVRADPAPACAPCLARRCDHRAGPVCMTGLAPERVLAELRHPHPDPTPRPAR